MAFKHYKQIKTQELPSMNIDNVAAFLKDFAISDDSEKPITSGLFRLKAGESLKYTYTYHEMKFIVDGSFIIEDEAGQKVLYLFDDPIELSIGKKVVITAKHERNIVWFF